MHALDLGGQSDRLGQAFGLIFDPGAAVREDPASFIQRVASGLVVRFWLYYCAYR